jgi:hydrogenase maturation protease HycI
LPKPDRPLRLALVGIGHELRGDDAAGLKVAHGLRERFGTAGETAVNGLVWLVLEAGPAPENVTGALRRFRPDLVLFIDAAQMDEPAGTIRWLTPQETDGFGASTHSLPFSVLATYLTAELGCEVALIGLQPAANRLGVSLSPAVAHAVNQLAAGLPTVVSPPHH